MRPASLYMTLVAAAVSALAVVPGALAAKTPPPSGPPPQFANPVGFATGVGSHPATIGTGDFNADGKQDVVTSSSSNVAVELLLGKGDGTLQPFTKLPNANDGGVFNPVVGDFNGDGKLDLVGSGAGEPVPGNPNAAIPDISVVLGNGDGTFASRIVDHSGAGSPTAAVDVNGDGKIDSINIASGTQISVSLGNGDGTFQPRTAYTVGKLDSAFASSSPRQVAVDDVNGDGVKDLVSANESSNCVAGPGCPPGTGSSSGDVSVLLGNGDGSFQPSIQYTASFPRGVALGDVNGDGRPDIATAGQNSMSQVLINRGDGTFAAPITMTAGASPLGVVIKDLNGDGKLDVVVNNHGGSPINGKFVGTISYFQGNGDGTFLPQAAYRANGQPAAISVADFNGDGYPDIAVPNVGDNTATLIINNAPGAAIAPAPVPGGGGGGGKAAR